LPHVTLYFELPTPRRLPALNRPAHSIVHMWALHQAMLVAPAASLLVYPRLCGLTTRRPPRTGTGRQQRDCCASQKASADDYLVGSQVSRRISGQSKRDRADLRQRSRSMTTAFQANSLAPMGWNLEPESKIDRHHHCSTSIVVWTDSCTRLFGPRWVGGWVCGCRCRCWCRCGWSGWSGWSGSSSLHPRNRGMDRLLLTLFLHI